MKGQTDTFIAHRPPAAPSVPTHSWQRSAVQDNLAGRLRIPRARQGEDDGLDRHVRERRGDGFNLWERVSDMVVWTLKGMERSRARRPAELFTMSERDSWRRSGEHAASTETA